MEIYLTICYCIIIFFGADVSVVVTNLWYLVNFFSSQVLVEKMGLRRGSDHSSLDSADIVLRMLNLAYLISLREVGDSY